MTAATPTLDVGGSLELNSRYVWRGLAWSEGVVVQPSLWIDLDRTSLELWVNWDPTPPVGPAVMNEVDLTLSRQLEIGRLELEPAISYYHYPHQDDSPPTGEIELTGCMNFDASALSVSVSMDYLEYSNAWTASAGWERWLSIEDWEGSIAIEAGWGAAQFNEAYVGVKRSRLLYTGISFALERAVGGWLLGGRIALTTLPEEAIRQLVDEPTLIAIGLSVGR
ncbi:MAG: hypothetical protein FJY67_06045 [Calditrichaeota bacterium]|nr:hypothetical protein [Calditrichota bacterium]